jgi:hypothetical protein
VHPGKTNSSAADRESRSDNRSETARAHGSPGLLSITERRRAATAGSPHDAARRLARAARWA